MIKFSQSTINDIYFGNISISKVYFGSTLIFEKENSSYVLYEFTKELETLYNTIEDSVKSAFFYGNTPINLINGHELISVTNVYTTYENGVYTYQARGNYTGTISPSNILKITTSSHLELNKTYTLCITQLSNDSCQFGIQANGSSTQTFLEYSTHNAEIHKFTFRLTSDYDTLHIRLADFGGTARSLQFKDIMILEGDYTQEVINTVKSPTLKLLGKNTFNVKNKGYYRAAWYAIPLDLPVDEEVYVKGDSSLPNDFRVNIMANNKENALDNPVVKKGSTAYYKNITSIDFYCPSLSIAGLNRGNLDELVANGSIVIKLGGEPYKSITLTTPSDFKMSSNNETRDALNLLTGKFTQRIDENGSILNQEIIKTIDLTIVDQDGNSVPTLKTFNDITYAIVKSETTVLPTVSLEVAFDSNATQTVSEDQNSISLSQDDIEETMNSQSQETETAMIGVTEVYEQQV